MGGGGFTASCGGEGRVGGYEVVERGLDWDVMGCVQQRILSYHFVLFSFSEFCALRSPRVFFFFVRFVCSFCSSALFVPGTQVQGKARFALFVRARVLAYLCMYAGE